jgi:hypothetical protein
MIYNNTKAGQMAEGRRRLALNRWRENLQKAITLNIVKAQVAVTPSMPVTEADEKPSMQNVTVQPTASSAPIAPESVTYNDGVTVTSHSNTRELKHRNCDFCFEHYAYRDYRSRYCSGTCRTDASLVRIAYQDGYALHYYHEIEIKNENN